MTTIQADAPVATLINVFTVEPARQAELVAALNQATEQLFVGIPGFVSANIHASLDGARVVNYAQWASPEHFQAMLQRPDAQQHMGEIMRIADNTEPRLFIVCATHSVSATTTPPAGR
ncbi:antibiotic biosynthesis monooxygenase [Kutzneria viridogrisea]|uniref:Heme-degrading monooxygenase HmoA n=1 Tax=Kutzneria viridogrisea TaxID=47990 RepID=A0ABR6B7Z7_9PSEU|nr:heme-degrading monooxygenase HmoA [Kutzneria viridogrisea]